MRTLIFLFLFFSVQLVLAGEQHVIAHEWGTFTTLSTSEGKYLPGLYVDDTRLPDFVYDLPYYGWTNSQGWPTPEKLRNVTVKLETPVLYFYCPHEEDVNVKVGFNGGIYNQWYPERVSGDINPSSPFIDFAQGLKGSIEWNVKILDPNTTESLTQKQVSHEWSAPRNTSSNLVRASNGEIEKYLFYRGLGNFDLPVKAKFLQDGSLQVSNESPHEISHFMIYENKGYTTLNEGSWMESPFKIYIWGEGKLMPLETKNFNQPDSSRGVTNSIIAGNHLEEALIKAGLYSSEANAMLQTWKYSYFSNEKGMKLFWIVPQPLIDSLLPLTITPMPGNIQRVFVARSEILPPYIESEIRQRLSIPGDTSFINHKYRYAFQAFYEDELNTSVSEKPLYPINLHPEKQTLVIDGHGSTRSLGGKQNILGQRKTNHATQAIIREKR